jgi:hypothetical protein
MLNFGEHEEFDDISSVCFYEETEIIDDTKIHKYSLKSNENKENFKFQDDDLKKKEYDNIDNEKTRTNTNFLKNEMEEKDINDNILEKNFDQTYNFVIDDDNNVNKKNEISNSNIVFKVEKKNLGRKKKEKTIEEYTKKKVHSFNSQDNIVRKIRIYSIKFALNLINDCMVLEFGKIKRRKIRGICKEITSDITINFNIYFFEKNLGEIFSNPLNEKYKLKDKDQNIKEISKIRKLREKSNKALLINELLDLKFNVIYDMFVYGNKEENKEKYLKYGKSKNTLNLEELLSTSTFKNKYNENYINSLRTQAYEIKKFYNPLNARNLRKKDKKFKNTNFENF